MESTTKQCRHDKAKRLKKENRLAILAKTFPLSGAKIREQQRLAGDILGVPVNFTNELGIEFKLIPAGVFWMGSEKDDACKDEKPVHRVEITKPFYLGKYPVTQAEYEKLMGENPSYFIGRNKPVDSVSWEDAMKFCEKLSQRIGELYRLPTEAEWEYACRAGTFTEYYWGNDNMESKLKQYAWYSGNADQRFWTTPHVDDEGTQIVGKKKPNGWGLHDMIGNILEWCVDWYGVDYYRTSQERDPRGPDKDISVFRVLRGGSWYLKDCYLRSALRFNGGPKDSNYDIGFRVIQEFN